MRKEYVRRIMLYLKNERNRAVWKKILYGMACVVVFFTVYALILPAITMEQEYYCGIEVHEHTEDCYEYGTVTQIVCPPEEFALHEHAGSCWDLDGNVICGYSDTAVHYHDEYCYDDEGVLVCAAPELAEHTHNDSCRNEAGELVCGLAEIQLHTHIDSCFDRVGNVVCGRTEIVAHQHTEACTPQEVEYQELICTVPIHVHDYNCKPDPEADLETAADWEQSVAVVSLTDVWSDDLAAIARTQLGCMESQRNYLVENGERLSGYTRYGAWFGTPYAEWDALFVSFCLNYANVPYEAITRESDSQRWADTLSAHGILFSGEDYVPAAGDLVFFRDEQGAVDRVGIYTSMYTQQDAENDGRLITYIWAIEGDADDAVAERRTELTGYAPLYCSLDAARQRYGVLYLGEKLSESSLWSMNTEEPAVIEDAEPQLLTQTAETESYIVTVTYSSELELPENAVLQVAEYARDSEIFRQRCEEAGYELAWLLNIGFFVDGVELDLDGDFDVVVTSKQGGSLGSDITHFGDEGTERISGTEQADEGQSSVSFSSGGFSDYGGGVAAADTTSGVAYAAEKTTKDTDLSTAALVSTTYDYSFYKFTTVDSSSIDNSGSYVVYFNNGDGTYTFLIVNNNSISATTISTAKPSSGYEYSDLAKTYTSEPINGGDWYVPVTNVTTLPTTWTYSSASVTSGEDGPNGNTTTNYDRLASGNYLTLGSSLSLSSVNNNQMGGNTSYGYNLTFTDQSDAGATIKASVTTTSGNTSGRPQQGGNTTTTNTYYITYSSNSGWNVTNNSDSAVPVYFATYTTSTETVTVEVDDGTPEEDESTLSEGTLKFVTVDPNNLVEGENYVVFCKKNNTADDTTEYSIMCSMVDSRGSTSNYPCTVDFSTISDAFPAGFTTEPVTCGGVWYVPKEHLFTTAVGSTVTATEIADIQWRYSTVEVSGVSYSRLEAIGYKEGEYIRVQSNGTIRTYNDTVSDINLTFTDINGAACKISSPNGNNVEVSYDTSDNSWVSVSSGSGYTFYFAQVEEIDVGDGDDSEDTTVDDNQTYYPYHTGDQDYVFQVMEVDEQIVEGQTYVIYFNNVDMTDSASNTYPGVKFLGSRDNANVSVPIGVNETAADGTVNIDLSEERYTGGAEWRIDKDVLDTATGTNSFLWVAEYDANGNLVLHSKDYPELYLYLNSAVGANKNSVKTQTLAASPEFYIDVSENSGDNSDAWRVVSTVDGASTLYYNTANQWISIADTSNLDSSTEIYKIYIAKAMSYPTAVQTGTISVNRLRFYNYAENGFQGDGVISAAPLAGCVFEIKDSSGNLVETITSNADDAELFLTESLYTTGTYTITEVSVPDGYVGDITPSRSFTIVSDSEGLKFAADSDGEYLSIGTFINHKIDQITDIKNASVEDYEYRTYQVLLQIASNMRNYEMDPIDVMLVVDQSNSMLFPSGLNAVTNADGSAATVTLYRNASEASETEQIAADAELNIAAFEALFEAGTITRDQVYYIIADKEAKSTVYAVWYNGEGWCYQDASFYAKAYYGNATGYQESSGELVVFAGYHDYTTYFTQTVDGEVVTYRKNGGGMCSWLRSDLGDEIDNEGGSYTYELYTAYDGYNRLHYLQDSLANTVYQLAYANSENRAKLILFTRYSECDEECAAVNSYRLNATGVESLVDAVGKINTTGGTRQDHALKHALAHHEAVNAAAEAGTDEDRGVRYTFTVLITDGSPNANSSILGTVDEVLDSSVTREQVDTDTDGVDTDENDEDQYHVFPKIRYYADLVKQESILMTVGLGMYKDSAGWQLMQSIATTEDYATLLQKTDDLLAKLKAMVDVALIPKEKITTTADLVDEISDSFYPIAWVENGTSTYYDNTAGHRVVETNDSTRKWIVLEEGDWITLEGGYTTAGASDAAGQLLKKSDGTLYIQWLSQALDDVPIAWVESADDVPTDRSVLYVENGRYYFELYSEEWVSKNSDQTNKFKYYGTKTVGDRVGNTSTDYNLIGQLLSDDDVGYYIKWNDDIPLNSDRDYPSYGWQGIFYVKAKEDFIGGNAIDTNKSATAVVNDNYGLGGTVTFGVPTVNVRLLPMNEITSEVTVFLGDDINRYDTAYAVDLSSPFNTLKYFYDETYIEKIGWDPNYVRNCSFEIHSTDSNDRNLSVWKWEYDTAEAEILMKSDADDAFTGSYYLNICDRNADGIDANIYQTITGLEPGTYLLSAMAHGGDAGDDTVMTLYADFASSPKTNHDASTTFELAGWQNWQNPTIVITVPDSGTVTVGVSMEGSATGKYTWCSLDDIVLMKLPEDANTINKTAMDTDSSAFTVAESGIDYGASSLEFTRFGIDYAIGQLTDTQWTTLENGGTVSVDYTYDNASSRGAVGKFNFSLAKTGSSSAYDTHTATVTGEAVETYTLNVTYEAYQLGEADSSGTARDSANSLNGAAGPGTEVGGSDAGSTLETGAGVVTVADVHTVNVIDGSIEVTKVIDSSLVSDKDRTFYFTLHRSEDGTETANDRTGTITVPANETTGSASIVWTGLQRGTYTIREGDDADYHVSGIKVLDTTNCKSSPAIGGTATNVTFGIGYYIDGNDVIGTDGSGNYPYTDYIGDYDNVYDDNWDLVSSTRISGVYGAAEFTNTKTEYEGTVTVSKIWSGDGESNADTMHNGHTVYVVLYQDGTLVEDNDGNARMVKLTADNNWTATYTVALTNSTDKVSNYNYTIGEVNEVSTTKSGILWQSAVLENPSDSSETTALYYDKVLSEGKMLEFSDPDLSYIVSYQEAVTDTSSERGDVSLTVTNERAYELPETGGPGDLILMVNGALFLAAALRYGYNQSGKRRRRAS